jgi:hypothetical protein
MPPRPTPINALDFEAESLDDAGVDLDAPVTLPDEPETNADAVTLDSAHRIARNAAKRSYIHALNVANAAKELQRLPDPGETIHLVMRGNFAAWDLVPATLRLLNTPAGPTPYRIDALTIATLGFNDANLEDLCAMLDAGQIGKVAFLCSCYFRDANALGFKKAADALAARHMPIIATRNHAKILLMATSRGDWLTIETSANLRSCKNIEQACITSDRALYDFHAEWIAEVMEKATRRLKK